MKAHRLKPMRGEADGGFGELAAELVGVDAVFGGFARGDEDYRDVVAVEGGELGVLVNIDFAQDRAEFVEERLHDELGVFAEMAARTSIERNFERTGRGGHGLGFE